MRLIDADTLCEGLVSNHPVAIATKCAPTIEANPVVHARWIAEYRTICSACKTQFDDDMFWIQGDFIKPNYCPNCGARMDGDDNAAD